jgi:hypothetical protein
MARQSSALIHQVLFTSDEDDGCGPMAAVLFNAVADASRAAGSSAGFRAAANIAAGASEAVADLCDLSSVRPEVVSPRRIRDATLMIHLGSGFEEDADGILVLAWDFPGLEHRSATDFRAIRRELERRIADLVTTRRWAPPRALCPICCDPIVVARDVTTRHLSPCPGCTAQLVWVPGYFTRCAPVVHVHRPDVRGSRYGLA